MRVGIIGVGIVGDATKKVLEEFHEIFPYDKYKESYNSEENLNRLAKNSEVVFICVSTPMKPNGEMDYSSVYNSLDSLQKKVEETRRDPQGILIIIRSAVMWPSTPAEWGHLALAIACMLLPALTTVSASVLITGCRPRSQWHAAISLLGIQLRAPARLTAV